MGGLFSVALSCGSLRLAVNQHLALGARTFLPSPRPATTGVRLSHSDGLTLCRSRVVRQLFQVRLNNRLQMSLQMKFAREQLIFLLQLAYSGELAAVRAYLGHRSSLRSRRERAEVAQIIREELEHRQCLLKMLQGLGASADPVRERKMNWVGKAIALFCRVGGWFFPMYGAARLEAQNIREYELAARLAHSAGLISLVQPLLEMAEVEWDHELYFRSKAMQHWLWHIVPKWRVPSLRSEIQKAFKAFEKEGQWKVPQVRPRLLVR